MADETEQPQDNQGSEQPSAKPSKFKEGAAKSILAIGDWLDKPVKNKVDGYGYKNNGQMLQGRTSTAFNWAIDSIERPINEAANAFASGKIEDLYINVPLAMAGQLLKILDGLNNWIKNIERHPELGQIKDNGNITGNIPRPEKTDTQTQNLAKPERSDEPTKNLGNDGKTDNKTQNIPTPTKNSSLGQNVHNVSSTVSDVSSNTAKIADVTMKAAGLVAPVMPEAAAVAGVAATVKTVAQSGQQLGNEGQKLGNQLDPSISSPRQPQEPTISVSAQNQPEKPVAKPKISTAGLKLNEAANKISKTTISVKDNALANLSQSRATRDNSALLSKIGNILANMLHKNKPRTQQQNPGLTLGNRGMAMA